MWFKVDDGFYDHPKADLAGTAALGLWARCGSYAGRHLTDGFVPEAVARRFGSPAMIKSLLAARLWDRVTGGYQFHEWGESNPTREDVEAAKAAAADRKRRSRSRRDEPVSPSDVTPPVTRDIPVTERVTAHVTDAGVTSPSRGRVDPTRPDPTRRTTSGGSPQPQVGDPAGEHPPGQNTALAGEPTLDQLVRHHPQLGEGNRKAVDAVRRRLAAGVPLADVHRALDRLDAAGSITTTQTLQFELNGGWKPAAESRGTTNGRAGLDLAERLDAEAPTTRREIA